MERPIARKSYRFIASTTAVAAATFLLQHGSITAANAAGILEMTLYSPRDKKPASATTIGMRFHVADSATNKVYMDDLEL